MLALRQPRQGGHHGTRTSSIQEHLTPMRGWLLQRVMTFFPLRPPLFLFVLFVCVFLVFLPFSSIWSVCTSFSPSHWHFSVNKLWKCREWVIEIDKCRVSMEQLGNSFKPRGWVESYVVNAYCRKLFRDNHPRKSQRHYFFHTAAVSSTTCFFCCLFTTRFSVQT